MIDRMRKVATCIYIAVQKDIADDVSSTLLDAVAHIEDIEAKVEELTKAAREIWEADQEGRDEPYSARLSDAIDALEPLLEPPGEQHE